MSKSNDAEEVRVLRFFEDGPIDKAELIFNIVAAKMHQRRQPKTANGAEAPAKTRKARKPLQRLENNHRNGTPDLASADN